MIIIIFDNQRKAYSGKLFRVIGIKQLMLSCVGNIVWKANMELFVWFTLIDL